MILYLLRLRFLGDEDIGKDDGNSKENDDNYHAFTQPPRGLSHPLDAAIFSLLGMFRQAIIVV